MSGGSSSDVSYRGAGHSQSQRFHKQRRGQLLQPHDGLSGLLWSVNPRQESKAVRELQLYLSSLVEDLEVAQKKFVATQSTDAALPVLANPGEDCHRNALLSSGEDNNANGDTSTAGEESHAVPAPQSSALSLSSMLAAELAEAVENDEARFGQRRKAPGAMSRLPTGVKRARPGDDNDDDYDQNDEDDECSALQEGDKTHDARHASKSGRRYKDLFMVPLETNCKGYVLMNIPSVNPRATCLRCNTPATQTSSSTPTTETSTEKTASLSDADLSSAGVSVNDAAHAITINPLVAHVVERIFHDLESNPRPVLRQCFRLTPVELTCCPTSKEMQSALRALLLMHFPLSTEVGSSSHQSTDTKEKQGKDVISFDRSLQHLVPPPPTGRSMYTIGLQITIKNNNGVAAKRQQLERELRSCIPQNRFIVASNSIIAKAETEYRQRKEAAGEGSAHERGSGASIAVEGVVQIFVAHSTCVMGIQRKYSERCGFNVHAIGDLSFSLS